MNDAHAFEHVTYRVEWVFKIGTIGDSEGRTWAKDLIEEKPFATKAEAEAYRDTHPDLELSHWKIWRPKNNYGLFAIVRKEVRIDPLADPRVLALVELIAYAQQIVDPCYPASHADWQNKARAALAALRAGVDT